MLRFVVALVLASAAAVLATGAEEVPVHMTAGTPLALQPQQHHDEAPRFAEAQGQAQAEAKGEAESEAEAEAEAETEAEDESEAEGEAEAESEKPTEADKEVSREHDKLARAEVKELLVPDTVIAESTNTMTLSARCLMGCANNYGLCTRTNHRGCACAAGCMCNRGDAGATCAQHCHPDNHMNFVYGYHDADHFSPHLWGKTIGDTMTDYQQVRACLAGCARRGKCKPRFCPRHPSGGYKCKACKRLQVVPHSHRRREKVYHTVERVTRTAHFPGHVTVSHSHDHVDVWGHHYPHYYTHSHYTDAHAYPRFSAADASADSEAAAETETESESESGSQMKVVMEGESEGEMESESESDASAEDGMDVHMEQGAAQVVEADEAMNAAAESDAAMEAQAQAEAEDGYVHVVHTPYVSAVTADASNIRRWQPRVLQPQSVRPVGGQDIADNGIVSAHRAQDPLAKKIDCNFYDCTGTESEPYVPVGSMNPVKPYVWKRDTRTTTFSTVPDMLEPRTEYKTVVIA